MNIVFDLGGVVFEWEPERLFAQIFTDPAEHARAFTELYENRDWLDLDRGTLDMNEAAKRAAERTGLDESRFLEVLRLVPEALIPIQDTVTLMRSLKRGGHRLLCLSNMHRHSIEALEARERFWDLFDGRLISCRIHSIKPEPEIYRELLDKFGLDPAETVFIDDSPENLVAAERFGLQTIHFTGVRECEAALERLDRHHEEAAHS